MQAKAELESATGREPTATATVDAGAVPADRRSEPRRRLVGSRTSPVGGFSAPLHRHLRRLPGAADPGVVRPRFTDFSIGNSRTGPAPTSSASTTTRSCSTTSRSCKAARNTAFFVVVGVPLTIAAGLLAAVALNQGIGQAAGALPRRLLPAGRHEHRRHRGRSGATCSTRTSAPQRRARPGRDRRARTGSASRRPRCRRSSRSASGATSASTW